MRPQKRLSAASPIGPLGGQALLELAQLRGTRWLLPTLAMSVGLGLFSLSKELPQLATDPTFGRFLFQVYFSALGLLLAIVGAQWGLLVGSCERRNNCADTLLLTPLRPRTIVHQKAAALMVQLTTVALTFLPSATLLVLNGTTTLKELAAAFALVLAAGVFVAWGALCRGLSGTGRGQPTVTPVLAAALLWLAASIGPGLAGAYWLGQTWSELRVGPIWLPQLMVSTLPSQLALGWAAVGMALLALSFPVELAITRLSRERQRSSIGLRLWHSVACAGVVLVAMMPVQLTHFVDGSIGQGLTVLTLFLLSVWGLWLLCGYSPDVAVRPVDKDSRPTPSAASGVGPEPALLQLLVTMTAGCLILTAYRSEPGHVAGTFRNAFPTLAASGYALSLLLLLCGSTLFHRAKGASVPGCRRRLVVLAAEVVLVPAGLSALLGFVHPASAHWVSSLSPWFLTQLLPAIWRGSASPSMLTAAATAATCWALVGALLWLFALRRLGASASSAEPGGPAGPTSA